MSNRFVRKISGQRNVIGIIIGIMAIISIVSMVVFYLSPDSDRHTTSTVDGDHVGGTTMADSITGDGNGDSEMDVEKPVLSTEDGSFSDGGSRFSEVSYATLQRLNEGTILSFGDLDATNAVSIITDPAELSSEGIYGDKSLIDAVSAGDFRLNLYLSPSDESVSRGVDSMVRTATCLIGIDEDETNATTLQSIMAASESFTGAEDLTEMSTKMGAAPDIQCADTATESATSTSNNALHFMTHFRSEEPNIMVNSTGAVIGATDLKNDWVSIVASDQDIKTAIG